MRVLPTLVTGQDQALSLPQFTPKRARAGTPQPGTAGICSRNTCCLVPWMERLGLSKTTEREKDWGQRAPAPSRALLSADDAWAAACEQGLGWYRSSSEEARPLQARARGQTPPPSQPHKCHNCQTSGSAISSPALPPHSLQNSSPTSEGTPPLSPTSQL